MHIDDIRLVFVLQTRLTAWLMKADPLSEDMIFFDLNAEAIANPKGVMRPGWEMGNYLILLNFKCMILPEFTSNPVILFLLSRIITK